MCQERLCTETERECWCVAVDMKVWAPEDKFDDALRAARATGVVEVVEEEVVVVVHLGA